MGERRVTERGRSTVVMGSPSLAWAWRRLTGALRGAWWVGVVLYLAGCAHGQTAQTPVSEAAPTVRPPPSTLRAPIAAPDEGVPLETESATDRKAPDLYRGTGVFVKRPPAEKEVVPAAGEVTLNFENANLREVVKVILGDMLEENYVIDPRVNGTVTVQTSRPLTRDALLPTLEFLLRMNGASLVKNGEGYSILPATDALRGTTSPEVWDEVGPFPAGTNVQIVPLKFIGATEMQKLLEPFAPAGSIVRADDARHLLVLAGTRQELANLVATIQVFDVDWLAAMSLGLFPLKSVDAATVVNELDQVLGEGGPLGGVLKVVPIERLNALLVVTPQPKYLEDARTWIERLDRTSDVAGRRLYVYHVQNSRAESLAEILSGLFGTEAKSVKAAGPPRLAPGLSGTELTSGSGGGLGAGSAFGSSLTGTSTGLMGQMVMQAAAGQPAAAAPASPAAPAAQAPAPSQPNVGRAPQRPGKGASLEDVGEVSIIADQEHNALVILATPADYEKIEAAIKRLDIVPLQVLIEATIVEVTLSNELSYGVRWWFENKLGNEHTGIGAFRLTGDVTASSIDPGNGFTYAIVNASDLVRAQIDALVSEDKGKVLQAPSLMVLDNQTANIRVGDQVPINTGSTTGSGGTTTQTFQFRDTGVLLEVTPRVNAGGLVMMEVSQEVSRSIPDPDNPGGNPTIRQRSIATTVAVQSGETVVLGGLIMDQEDRGRSGIPGLSKLPVLGALFSTTSTTKARNELLVVITPQAVRDREEARRVTREFRDRLQEIKSEPWAGPQLRGMGG